MARATPAAPPFFCSHANTLRPQLRLRLRRMPALLAARAFTRSCCHSSHHAASAAQRPAPTLARCCHLSQRLMGLHVRTACLLGLRSTCACSLAPLPYPRRLSVSALQSSRPASPVPPPPPAWLAPARLHTSSRQSLLPSRASTPVAARLAPAPLLPCTPAAASRPRSRCSRACSRSARLRHRQPAPPTHLLRRAEPSLAARLGPLARAPSRRLPARCPSAGLRSRAEPRLRSLQTRVRCAAPAPSRPPRACCRSRQPPHKPELLARVGPPAHRQPPAEPTPAFSKQRKGGREGIREREVSLPVKERGNQVEEEQREKKEEWISPRTYA
jgi:hypothetical protein